MRLSSLGHDVYVFDFIEEQCTDYLSVKNPCQAAAVETFKKSVADVHEIKAQLPSKGRYLAAVAALRRIARECRAEVIVSLYGGGFALMAYLSRLRPYAVYVVGSDVLLIGRFNRWLSRRTLTAAKAVFANGRYLAEQTRALAPRANVVPLLFGVDVEKFFPDSPPASPVRLVCTRGFHPLYNNDYLIRGLALLPEGLPEFRVTFVSPGPSLPGPGPCRQDALAGNAPPRRVPRRRARCGVARNSAVISRLPLAVALRRNGHLDAGSIGLRAVSRSLRHSAEPRVDRPGVAQRFVGSARPTAETRRRPGRRHHGRGAAFPRRRPQPAIDLGPHRQLTNDEIALFDVGGDGCNS